MTREGRDVALEERQLLKASTSFVLGWPVTTRVAIASEHRMARGPHDCLAELLVAPLPWVHREDGKRLQS